MSCEYFSWPLLEPQVCIAAPLHRVSVLLPSILWDSMLVSSVLKQFFVQASAFRAENASYKKRSEPAKQTERMIEVRDLLLQAILLRH